MNFRATFPTVPGFESADYIFRLVGSSGEIGSIQSAGGGATVVGEFVDVDINGKESLYVKCAVEAPAEGWKSGATAPEGQSNTLNVDPRPAAPAAPGTGTLEQF